MLLPTANIVLGDKTFPYCSDLKIRSSWKDLIDTAFVSIPGKVRNGSQVITITDDNLFRSGQTASIELGYYPDSELVFEGYISAVRPGFPVEVDLEDGGYLLKRWTISNTWRQTTLKEVVTDMMSMLSDAISADVTLDDEIRAGFQAGISRIGSGNVVDAGLGDFRADRVTPAQVFQKIRQTYGLASYMRGFDLYVGLPYTSVENPRNVRIETGVNWIDDNLKFVRAEDQRIKVVVKSLLPNNDTVTVEGGDPTGDQRTIFVFGETDVSKLQKIASDSAASFKYEGFRGKIETFGRPVVRHGDVVDIQDNTYISDRIGQYFVQEVETRSGVDGYFQDVTLGARAS